MSQQEERTRDIATVIKIGNRFVGSTHPCYIVAELSCNHKQSFNEAVEIIRAAATAGADAIKLQTYTPDTLTINSNKSSFQVDSQNAPESWKNSNLYHLYETAFTPWDWHAPLQEVARNAGIDFFSTPFDETAVRFLEQLKVPCHKIASYELTYTQLLRSVASTRKPVILSVGFATLEEIEEAVMVLRNAGAVEIALLHCVTTYSPSPDASVMRLSTIRCLQEKFGVVVGFSDNNGGGEFPVMSVLSGACIVEKHLTLSKESNSHDSKFSLDPAQFADMVRSIRRAEVAVGSASFGTANDVEQQFRKYRRSIFVVRNVSCGEHFTSENVRVIRPAHGLEPVYLEQILGSVSTQDIEEGTPLSWDMVEGRQHH